MIITIKKFMYVANNSSYW